ncbi:hypothetical protein C2S51_020939 [Perilla frutescens var. frutescens]|nr:hypothetical protein C2S51_020939 [Perilla frutescens var. frutescens]
MNKVTAAARLALVLVVLCMAGKAAAADNHPNPKELIKEAMESAVAEIQSAIKNTSTYKKVAADKLTRGALDICEDALNSSIFRVRMSFDNIDRFDIGEMDHILDDVRVWLSAAITCKTTCIDAFDKTKGDMQKKVIEILKSSGQLLNKCLGMVIEFQKFYRSLNLGNLSERINKQRQLLDAPTTTTTLSLTSKPRVTVAQDGSGQYKTIQEAINTVAVGNEEPFVILVKAGVYPEYVFIPKKVNHVVLVGEGPLTTVITGSKSYAGGIGIYASGTLIVEGDNFMAMDIGIENTAGVDGEQAVAVRASGDWGIFYKVHMSGYQDTLLADTNRQLYRDCRISGTVDFVFGNAITIIQKSEVALRKSKHGQECVVTAQGRDEKNTTGVILIQGCKFTAEKEFLDTTPAISAYLGRPWKSLSTTIIMQSFIDGFISPLGWEGWLKSKLYLDTINFAEYDNSGPSANCSLRVDWNNLHCFKTAEEAAMWTPQPLFMKEDWIHQSGVPYTPGFMDTLDLTNFFDPQQIPTFSPQKTKKTTRPHKKTIPHKKNKKPIKSDL